MQLRENDIFIGLLLSDASLGYYRSKQNKSSFRLKQTLKFKDMIDETKIELEKYNYKINVWQSNQKLKSTNKAYDMFNLESNSTKELGELRKIWYPEGIKIVPKYFKLTPKILAYWFMGDGNSSFSNKKRSVSISLETQGFYKEDVEYLVKKLDEDLGIKSKAYLKRNGFVIRLFKADQVTKFMDLVKPYILPCFQYKLKYPSLVNTGNAPSRTANAQKKYWHSLPKKVRQARMKKRWNEIKEEKNRERRERYAKDSEYRKKCQERARLVYAAQTN